MVVGLGNPGSEYERTRHNAGQRVVELLAQRHGASLKRGGGRSGGVAISGHARVGQKLLGLAIPGTFMNNSGESMAPLLRRYEVQDISNIVIVHDEVDLPVGKLQVKLGGGLAGHNGLKSIKQHLKDDGFARVRIGVGRPPGEKAGPGYVLKAPGAAERREAAISEERAADAIEAILLYGLDRAMNEYNR